jgi:hypothetical protein
LGSLSNKKLVGPRFGAAASEPPSPVPPVDDEVDPEELDDEDDEDEEELLPDCAGWPTSSLH